MNRLTVLSQNILLFTGIFVFCSCAFSERAQHNSLYTKNRSGAEYILETVRNSLPQGELFIRGRLISGKKINDPDKLFLVKADLKFTENTMHAEYTLMNAFGEPLSQLIMDKDLQKKQNEFIYKEGNKLIATEPPDLSAKIENTDITWNDLTLSFLWWQNGALADIDESLGRNCYVIEFPAAKNAVKNGTNTKLTKIWVDQKAFFLLKAEEYDGSCKIRSLSIRKLKKISGKWIVKEMRARSYPSWHKTLFRIDEFRMPE
jgi:hypothetical protein